MKIKILFVVFLSFIIWSCQENSDPVFMQQTGTVIDYAGSGNCGFVIELDDGKNIIPINYPEDFTFAQGQKVWVEYIRVEDINLLCEKGTACEINRIEQLGCESYIDLYFSNYDSLARDPVYIHSVELDGDCLHIKLSYSGGCEDHDIALARMHPWCATPPIPPPTFEIRHDSHGDLCEAFITREFRFDLSPIKDEGAKTFTVSALLSNDQVYHETFDYNW